ncbi:hypothetical protein AB1Y20_004454 [Prymnesium parvum]|uniref:No apical meristem-associated C-terminal domain-containing protein n=1 Tax=Prymnesium parvum TaxID=97485 RepID=A0AB34IY43_PRYPA
MSGARSATAKPNYTDDVEQEAWMLMAAETLKRTVASPSTSSAALAKRSGNRTASIFSSSSGTRTSPRAKMPRIVGAAAAAKKPAESSDDSDDSDVPNFSIQPDPKAEKAAKKQGGGGGKAGPERTSRQKPMGGTSSKLQTQTLDAWASNPKKKKKEEEEMAAALENDKLQKMIAARMRQKEETEAMKERVEKEMQTIMDNGVRVNPMLQAIHRKL